MLNIAENTVLKPLSLDDAPYMFQIIDEERDYLRKWLPFIDQTVAEQNIRDYIEFSLSIEGAPQFTIYTQEQFVGLVGFKGSDLDNRKIEIGYWLSQNAQGQGIMTSAVSALTSFAFNTMAFNRIKIEVAVDNHKSRKIPEKLGFTLEGIEREGELLVDHVFTDLAIYGLLKSEYQSRTFSADSESDEPDERDIVKV